MPTTATPATDPTIEASVFWLRNRRQIVASVVVVIIALLAVGGYWLHQQRRNTAAAEMLGAAKTAADFQKVISSYASSPAGATAYLLLAEQQRNEQKFADANQTLETFVTKYPKHELVSTARMAMAANLESMGKRDEALTTYQRLVASDPHSFNAPLALISQVHLLKDKKQIDEARRVCEKILTDYRDSFIAGEATRQLRLLKPAQSNATAPTQAPAVSVAPANPGPIAPITAPGAPPPTAAPPAASPAASLPKP